MRNEVLRDVITDALNSAFADMHTIVVAKIQTVQAKTISCQPSMSRLVNGVKIDLPEFVEVPLVTLQGGSSYIHMPIEPGDYCLLLISERCFDGWYNGQDFQVPLEYRIHDYSDAFAIVGINPFASAITIPDVITMIGDAFFEGNHVHEGNTTQTGNYDLTGDIIQTGNYDITGDIEQIGSFKNSGNLETGGKIIAQSMNINGQEGTTGTFNTNDVNKIITVTNGSITSIV